MIKSTITPSTSEVIALLDSDGSVVLLSASTPIGQGVQTTLTQICAEALGIDPDRISVRTLETSVTPFDTATASSRSTYHMGNAVLKAAADLKHQLIEFVAAQWDCPMNACTVEDGAVRHINTEDALPIAEVVREGFVGGGGTLVGRGYFSTDDDTGEDAYRSEFWMSGATGAEVLVDTETGSYEVERWINVADAGLAIDPTRVREQIRGAAVQGLGHVRSEEMLFEDGQQQNRSLLDYKVPTIHDIPTESEEIIVESREPGGPFGAKGVGETNTITVPPAIGNAIADATGARVTSLPITPEKVLNELGERDR